ncbi:hypothetical protein [Chamaesiphon sp. OTE_75_metabat_556]|nr:hypothetical protein [Chamaesiphon sp. OTE_75_metabat_556]
MENLVDYFGIYFGHLDTWKLDDVSEIVGVGEASACAEASPLENRACG